MPWIKKTHPCQYPTSYEIRKEGIGVSSAWQCEECTRLFVLKDNDTFVELIAPYKYGLYGLELPEDGEIVTLEEDN